MNFIDGSIDKVMCVGRTAAEVDAQIPTQLGTGPRGLHPKEGTH